MSPSHHAVVGVGKTVKGAARIYLQGKWLPDAGFTPGDDLKVTVSNSEIVLEAVPAGKGERKIFDEVARAHQQEKEKER